MQTVHITSDANGNVTNMIVTPTTGAVGVGQNSSGEWIITITQKNLSTSLDFQITAARGSGGNGTISSMSFGDSQFTCTGLNSTVVKVTDAFTSAGSWSFSFGLGSASANAAEAIIIVDPQIENDQSAQLAG